jgi:hypothetical protein
MLLLPEGQRSEWSFGNRTALDVKVLRLYRLAEMSTTKTKKQQQQQKPRRGKQTIRTDFQFLDFRSGAFMAAILRFITGCPTFRLDITGHPCRKKTVN